MSKYSFIFVYLDKKAGYSKHTYVLGCHKLSLIVFYNFEITMSTDGADLYNTNALSHWEDVRV
jgi:hypothetical protein